MVQNESNQGSSSATLVKNIDKSLPDQNATNLNNFALASSKSSSSNSVLSNKSLATILDSEVYCDKETPSLHNSEIAHESNGTHCKEASLDLELDLGNLPVRVNVLKNGLSILGSCPESDREVFYKLSLPLQNLQTNLKFLESFRYLQILELPGNGISSTAFLTNMPYLVRLNLSNNKLTKMLDSYPIPPNLQFIDLSKNQISSIKALSDSKYLRELRLDRNLITAIPKQAFLGNKYLTYLGLSYNAIANVIGLDDLPLQTLDLTHNKLTSINGLGSLQDLRELRLGHNCIGSLSGIEHNSESLRVLELNNNFVMHVEEIEKLTPLTRLTSLNLSHNSVANEKQYRSYALYLLPQLQYFDNIETPAEERVAARNEFDPPSQVLESLEHTAELRHKLRKYYYIQLTQKEQDLWNDTKPVIVLCGASGPGRKKLLQELLINWPQVFKTTVSHTTRHPRPGEVSGFHYYFVSHKEMEDMVHEGKLLQVVNIFGNTYGTSLDAIEEINCLDRVCVSELELEGINVLKRTPGLNVKFILLKTENEQNYRQANFSQVQVDSTSHTTQQATPSLTGRFRRASIFYGYGSADYEKNTTGTTPTVLGSPFSRQKSIRSDSICVDRQTAASISATKPVLEQELFEVQKTNTKQADDFQHQGIENDEHYSLFLNKSNALDRLAQAEPDLFSETIATNDFRTAYKKFESFCLGLLKTRYHFEQEL